MPMEIYGTPTSPYTRIARIAAAEFGFPLKFHDLRWRVSPAELFEVNPIGRVPLLVDGARRIADSRVIWAYLQAHPNAAPTASLRPLGGKHRWDEENLVSQIYATMDATMVLRGMAEEPPVSQHPYLTRGGERIENCLAAIEQTTARGYLVAPDSFGLAEAALISAARLLKGHGVRNTGKFRNIGALCGRFANRKSITGTEPVF